VNPSLVRNGEDRSRSLVPVPADRPWGVMVERCSATGVGGCVENRYSEPSRHGAGGWGISGFGNGELRRRRRVRRGRV